MMDMQTLTHKGRDHNSISKTCDGTAMVAQAQCHSVEKANVCIVNMELTSQLLGINTIDDKKGSLPKGWVTRDPPMHYGMKQRSSENSAVIQS